MATRIHFRYVVSDQAGSVIQNAKVFVYQPGTTTDFTGSAYAAKTGGSPIANGFVSNNQGEVEAFFDTPQSVDIRATDNSGAAFYASAPAVPITFANMTEGLWDLEPAREDHPTAIGLVGDITSIDAGDAAAAGAVGRYADAAHQHQYTTVPNSHTATQHADLVRNIWLPVHDGVVVDGGTLTTTGANPDAVRTISLADAAASGATWAIVFDDWASGAVSVRIYWAGSTTFAGVVRWSLQAATKAAGVDITTAGTATAFTSATQPTANQLIKETLTSTTITPANGDLFKIGVRRLGTDGADTYTGAALVIGVQLSYTAVE